MELKKEVVYSPVQDVYVGGAFGTAHTSQLRRLFEVSKILRRDRKKYASLLPETNSKVDKDGNEYFGSYRHLLEFLLRQLESLIGTGR